MPLRMPTVALRQRRHGKTWGIRWKPQWVDFDIETGRWWMWETRLAALRSFHLKKNIRFDCKMFSIKWCAVRIFSFMKSPVFLPGKNSDIECACKHGIWTFLTPSNHTFWPFSDGPSLRSASLMIWCLMSSSSVWTYLYVLPGLGKKWMPWIPDSIIMGVFIVTKGGDISKNVPFKCSYGSTEPW